MAQEGFKRKLAAILSADAVPVNAYLKINLAVSHKSEIAEMKTSVEINIRVIFAFCFDIYVKTFQSYPKTNILKCIILQNEFIICNCTFKLVNFKIKKIKIVFEKKLGGNGKIGP